MNINFELSPEDGSDSSGMDHSYGGNGSWSMIPNISVHGSPATPSSQDHLYLQQQQLQQQHQQQFKQYQQQHFQQLHQQQSQQFVHQQQQFQPPQEQHQQQQFQPQQEQHQQQSSLQLQQQQQQQQQSPLQMQQQQSPLQLQQQQQSPMQVQHQQQSPMQVQQQQQSPLQVQQQQQRYHLQQVQQQQQHQSLASQFHLLNFVENLADAVDNGNRDQHSDSLVNELNNQFEKCQQLLNSIAGSINAKTMTVEGQKYDLEENERMLAQRKELIAKYRSSVEEFMKSDA